MSNANTKKEQWEKEYKEREQEKKSLKERMRELSSKSERTELMTGASAFSLWIFFVILAVALGYITGFFPFLEETALGVVILILVLIIVVFGSLVGIFYLASKSECLIQDSILKERHELWSKLREIEENGGSAGKTKTRRGV